MLTPHIRNRPEPWRIWAADNGCFARPETFSRDRYLDWLRSRSAERATCLFATIPDVWSDAEATYQRIEDWPETLAALGYTPAFIAQDRCDQYPIPWDRIGALFIGGSDPWRSTPEFRSVVEEAKRRELYLHIGRVNSRARLQWARGLGAQSADGTLARFGPDIHIPRINRWQAELTSQQVLL